MLGINSSPLLFFKKKMLSDSRTVANKQKTDSTLENQSKKNVLPGEDIKHLDDIIKQDKKTLQKYH
jgi:hypothetical protein